MRQKHIKRERYTEIERGRYRKRKIKSKRERSREREREMRRERDKDRGRGMKREKKRDREVEPWSRGSRAACQTEGGFASSFPSDVHRQRDLPPVANRNASRWHWCCPLPAIPQSREDNTT